MTPHILLLHSPEGHPFLFTIQAIATIDPHGSGSLIHDTLGDRYRCQESFDAITEALGGLVMRPKKKTAKEFNATYNEGLR